MTLMHELTDVFDIEFGAYERYRMSPPKSREESPVKIRPVVHDDDCEQQAVTKMPESCTRWPCCLVSLRAKLARNRDGFMVCPLCECSYGK